MNCAKSCGVFQLTVFSRKFLKCGIQTFSNSSQSSHLFVRNFAHRLRFKQEVLHNYTQFMTSPWAPEGLCKILGCDSPNLEYKSHLAKIYCHPEFPPLGGVVIKEVRLPGFFGTSQNVENLLFQTPPRQFHQFARNLAYNICGPSWLKRIKRVELGQIILEFLNNNFLQIWYKTGSVGYFHSGQV